MGSGTELLKPFMINQKLRKISNIPPGISKITSILNPKRAKKAPEIKMIYPMNPHIDSHCGTSLEI